MNEMVKRLEKEMGLLDFQAQNIMPCPGQIPKEPVASINECLKHSGVLYLRHGRHPGGVSTSGPVGSALSKIAEFPALAAKTKFKLCRSEFCCPQMDQIRHVRHVRKGNFHMMGVSTTNVNSIKSLKEEGGGKATASYPTSNSWQTPVTSGINVTTSRPSYQTTTLPPQLQQNSKMSSTEKVRNVNKKASDSNNNGRTTSGGGTNAAPANTSAVNTSKTFKGQHQPLATAGNGKKRNSYASIMSRTGGFNFQKIYAKSKKRGGRR